MRTELASLIVGLKIAGGVESLPTVEERLKENCRPPHKLKVWFALNDDRPLFAFAGIWTEFKGDRGTKSKPIPGPHPVYGLFFDNRAERRRRAYPFQGDAGDPDDG